MAENHLFPHLKCSCTAYFIAPMDSATKGGSTIPPPPFTLPPSYAPAAISS